MKYDIPYMTTEAVSLLKSLISILSAGIYTAFPDKKYRKREKQKTVLIFS